MPSVISCRRDIDIFSLEFNLKYIYINILHYKFIFRIRDFQTKFHKRTIFFFSSSRLNFVGRNVKQSTLSLKFTSCLLPQDCSYKRRKLNGKEPSNLQGVLIRHITFYFILYVNLPIKSLYSHKIHSNLSAYMSNPSTKIHYILNEITHTQKKARFFLNSICTKMILSIDICK